MASLTHPHTRGLERRGLRHHLGAQLGVGAGQVLAGVGNLGFSVVAARVLPPGDFATLTAFLALSLLVAVPAGSLAAGSLLSTELHDRVAHHLRRVGTIVSVVLGVAVAVGGPAMGLPRVLALPAAALPVVALALALARAQLYAHRRPGAVAVTLVAEPLVRLTLGVGLLMALGAAGGAVGVAAAGAAALAIARRSVPPRPALDAGRLPAATGAGGVAAFLMLALVQNQDVLVVNARLGPDEAGTFAALSMLGGAALFAVWNAPMVLMPRAADDSTALPAALGVTAIAGAIATGTSLLLGGPLVATLVGPAYADAGGLLGPYVAAMSMLGLARVLAGWRCAHGHARSTAVLGALAVAGHVSLLLVATSAGSAATATLATTSGLAAVLGAAVARERTGTTSADVAAWVRDHVWSDAAARVATIASAVGLLLRAVVTRGLWLDEAITVGQARLPFGAMLAEIAATDVHPPLHQILLWGWIRVAGDGELAVRMPYVLVGAAVVPLLFVAGRDLYSRRAGAVAALLGAVAPLAVWYSQEARMYSLYMLCSLLAVWGQARAMRDGRWSSWGWFVLGTAGLLWSHWFALLQVGVQQLVLLVHVVRQRRGGASIAPTVRRWAVALGALALLLAPLAVVVGEQLAAYAGRGAGLDGPSQTGGAAADIAADLSIYRLAVNGVWMLAGYHANDTMVLLVALWPLAMLGAFAILGRGPWRPGTDAVVAAAAVPMLVLFGLGALKSNLFEVRYVIGSLPPVLLLVGRAAALPLRRTGTVVVAAALVAASLVGLADQQLNAENPRLYAFDEAIAEVASRAGPGDVVAYAPGFLEPVLDYYAPHLDARPLEGVDPTEVDGDIHVVASFIEEEPAAGRVGAMLARLEKDRGAARPDEAGNVSIWTYS